MIYNYLITINQHYRNDIVCFNDELDKLKLLNTPFCFIIHDSDENVKDTHIHIILFYSNLKKIDLLNIVSSADIEIIENLKGAYKYLIHDSKNSVDKKCYNLDDIYYYYCSDSLIHDLIKHNTKKSKDNEILDNIADNILNGVYSNVYDVLKDYKGVALKYFRSIKDLLDSCNLYLESFNIDLLSDSAM